MRSSNLTAAFALTFLLLASTVALPQARPQAAQKAYGDSEYRLGPDDVVQVFVWKDPDASATVVVRPDGKLSLPLIGELVASGKTCLELEKEISLKLGEFITEPVVNVIVKEVKSAKVSVLGEVKTPGVYPINNRATVIDAIALGGGFTEYAKRDKVMIIRSGKSGEPQHIPVNVDKLLKGGKGEMFYILPSDKIYVF